MAFPEFLRIATLANFSVSETNVAPTTLDIIDSMEIKLTEVLASSLRFSFEPVSPDDEEVGRQTEDGNWTGMVGMVQRGEADVIIYMLGIREDRSKVIDFTTPYSITRFMFATKEAERTSNIASFLSPFSDEVWYCILLYGMVKIFTVFILQKFYRRSERVSFAMPKLRSVGQHLLASSYAFADTCLSFFYAAVLLAFLTFPRQIRIRTVSELSRAVLQGTHQCATDAGSAIIQHFRRSNDSNLKIIGLSLSKWNGSFDVEEALDTSNSRMKVAFLGLENHFHSLNRGYFVSQESFFNSARGIGLKKGFCCKARLESQINYIWASGIYDKFMNDALFKVSLKNSKKPSSNESTLRSLSLSDFEGVFMLLLAGNALAFVVFLLEHAIFKYCKKRC